jgi:hypothetical protein
LTPMTRPPPRVSFIARARNPLGAGRWSGAVASPMAEARPGEVLRRAVPAGRIREGRRVAPSSRSSWVLGSGKGPRTREPI